MTNLTLQSYKVVLQNILKEAEHTYTFVFSKPLDFEWDEGTSVQLATSMYDPDNQSGVQEQMRHLSIISLPCENHTSFTTRISENPSPFKEYLANAKPGDEFSIIDPVCKMSLKRENRPVILISAGVAISTMRPLIKGYALDQSNIKSLKHLNIDSSGNYVYQKEINVLEKKINGFSNHYLDNRESFYQVLKEHFDKTAIYYLTGSDQFIIAISKHLLQGGVSIDAVVLDKEEPFYRRLYDTPFL
ncbi:MAG: hypothetical protein MJE63_31780 [Proteobacteria bacterium]|nr:hypothetical protein [Pseudomonadota bacterium]